KRLISREKQDWRMNRDVLKDRADLLRGEIESWKEKISQVAQESQNMDRESAELADQKDHLLRTTTGILEIVIRLEKGVRRLLSRCPEPLQDRVRLLSQRIPEDPQSSRLSLGERAQNVIGILNEMDKFAREITVASEVREVEPGVSAEVTVLYIGLGQAYYCNARRGLAGIGQPGPAGWIWSARNELAGAVSEAVAIYRNEKPAAYILLPVQARASGGKENP
ncbi:MAG: DUF3450 family protein, partial [Kiritimatiellia bacterium]|nr:DUF3450 family protein [Kiritimatiellia bacterium]